MVLFWPILLAALKGAAGSILGGMSGGALGGKLLGGATGMAGKIGQGVGALALKGGGKGKAAAPEMPALMGGPVDPNANAQVLQNLSQVARRPAPRYMV